MPGIGSSSPAVLIAHLAAATSRIRVGSGGVMLPNHQPLVVAEQFGTLEALHPGRIDLGIGRAPGTDPRTAAALRRGTDPLGADDFPEQLTELVSYFHGDGPVLAVPAVGHEPGRVAARFQRLQRPGRRPARVAVRVRAPLQRAQHDGRAAAVPADLPALRGAVRAVLR